MTDQEFIDLYAAYQAGTATREQQEQLFAKVQTLVQELQEAAK